MRIRIAINSIFEKKLLDFGRFLLLSGGVSTLGISVRERVISRIIFYLSVLLVSWILGALTPSETDKSIALDAHLGVAEIIIAKAGDPRIPQDR